MKRVNVILNDTDDQAVETINRYYGTGNRSAAIRLALRLIAERIEADDSEKKINSQVDSNRSRK